MSAAKTPLKPNPLSSAVVLTYADVETLSGLMGKNIYSQDPAEIKSQLLHQIGELTTFTVEGVPITLEPRLLTRLKSRCLDKPNFDKWLREIVIRQLHDYAGW